MQHQYRNDDSNPALIGNNRVTPEWVATPIASDSIDFNERSVASVIARSTDAALTLTLGVNGPLAHKLNPCINGLF